MAGRRGVIDRGGIKTPVETEGGGGLALSVSRTSGLRLVCLLLKNGFFLIFFAGKISSTEFPSEPISDRRISVDRRKTLTPAIVNMLEPVV